MQHYIDLHGRKISQILNDCI